MTKTGHWARRKEVREQEKNRKLRLEKATEKKSPN